MAETTESAHRPEDSFAALVSVPKSGAEPFVADGKVLGFTLIEFWRWSASDLISNTMRGVLAEFLVAQALGIPSGVRTEWDAYDLLTEDGIKIEVKSSAYVQTWHQKKLSTPKFDVGVKCGWDAATNSSAQTPCRSADVYVFALLHHKEKAAVNPMLMEHWTFYLLPTAVLNEKYPTQQKISFNALVAAGAVPANFDSLAETLRSLFPTRREPDTSVGPDSGPLDGRDTYAK